MGLEVCDAVVLEIPARAEAQYIEAKILKLAEQGKRQNPKDRCEVARLRLYGCRNSYSSAFLIVSPMVQWILNAILPHWI
jgi:hypothetical protein